MHGLWVFGDVWVFIKTDATVGWSEYRPIVGYGEKYGLDWDSLLILMASAWTRFWNFLSLHVSLGLW